MNKPTLIYFASRGRAELIRLILSEAGADWAEHPITVGKGSPPANGRPTDFAELKATGQLAFDAAPVWEEPNGFRLAQSLAIANYLARKHGLAGKTPEEQALVEQALGGYEDTRAEFRKLVATPPEQRTKLREEMLQTILPRWFGFYERLLEANGGGAGFLVGSAITSADLALWYLVETARENGFGAALEKCPLVRAHFDRIGARPNLAAYVKSTRRHPFVPWPR